MAGKHKYTLYVILVILILMIILLGSKANAQCFALSDESPAIDAGAIIPEMEGIPSFNGLPRTGKYPGDMPDIGAWEWFPGVDCENPTGNWTGVPLTYNPRLEEPPVEVSPGKPSGTRISEQ